MALLDTVRSLFSKKDDEDKIPQAPKMKLPDFSGLKNTISQTFQNITKPNPQTQSMLDAQNKAINTAGQVVADFTVRPFMRAGTEIGMTLGGAKEPLNIEDAPLPKPVKDIIYGGKDSGSVFFKEDEDSSLKPLNYQGEERASRKTADFITAKTPLPESAGVPIAIGLSTTGAALDAIPFGGGAKKSGNIIIKNSDDLVTAILKNVDEAKKIRMGSDLEEGLKLSYKTVKNALKDTMISPELLKKLEKGEIIEDINYVVRKQGDDLIFNVDNKFKETVLKPLGSLKEAVEKNVDKAQETVTKGVDLAKTQVEKGVDLTKKQMKEIATKTRTATENEYLKQLKDIGREDKALQKQTSQEVMDEVFGVTRREAEQFISEARAAAEEAGNGEILTAALERAKELEDTAKQFRDTVADPSTVGKLIPDVVKTKLDEVTQPVQELFKTTIGKYKYSDSVLDLEARGIEEAKRAYIQRGARIYQDARNAAEELLKRPLNEQEAGALLRGDVEKEFARQKTTGLTIGEDVVKNKQALEETFNGAHTEIASWVLAYEKELDDLISQKLLSPQQAEAMRLVNPQTFGKNLRTYVRTFYDSARQGIESTKINMQAAAETQLSFSTAKRKLTDAQWGQAYLDALNRNLPQEVSRSDFIPDHLIKQIEAGKEGAIAELGRFVKQSRGYVQEGEKAFTGTAYTLLNNWKDLKLLGLIADNPNMVSNTIQDGYSLIPSGKIFGPLGGKYVRSDIAAELLKDREQIAKGTDEVINSLGGYAAVWRYSKAVANLPTWVANFLTGTLSMQTLAGNAITNPANWKHYTKGYSEFRSQIPKGRIVSKELALFNDLGGIQGTFVDEEILGLAQETVEAYTKSGHTGYMKSMIAKTNQLISEGKLKALGEYYSYLDAANKYVTFLNRLSKGDEAIQAVKYAQKYHLDYSFAPSWVRQIKQNPIGNILLPFITFPALYSKMVVETLATHPQRFVPFFAIPHAWNTMWKIQNPELADQSEKQKPFYLKDNPLVITVGYDEETQTFEYINLDRFFNIYGLIQTARLLTGQGNEESFGDAMNFFTGPVINSGGPFTAVSEAGRGTDTFGRDVESPILHALKGALPIPNLVFNITDIIKTAGGYPARGKLRDLDDEIWKLAGITIYEGARDQLKKNIYQAESAYSDVKSRVKNILGDPRSSEGAKEQARQKLQEARDTLNEEIYFFLHDGTDAGDKAPSISASVVEGIDQATGGNILKDIFTGAEGNPLQSVQKARASAAANFKVKAPPKVKPINLSVPAPRKTAGVSLTMPDLQEDDKGFTSEEIRRKVRRGVRL